MPDIDVKGYLDRLREALPYVPPISTQQIKALHRKGDLAGVVKLIRTTMNVGVGLTLHWTSESRPTGAPAWINMPVKMPYYGTTAFNELKLDLFVRKQFARSASYDQFAIIIAHELSHVVLDSIEHPLRHEEKAVDLTAMLLGFSRLYFVASEKETGYYVRKRTTLGYLSRSEVMRAAKILVPLRLRSFEIAKAAAIPLLVIGWVPGMAAFIAIHNRWDLHERLAAQAAAIRRQAPTIIGSSTVLTGAEVGLFSMKRVYLVSNSDGHAPQNRDTLRARLREFTCTENERNVRDGATYVYEYRNAAGQILDQIAIDTCSR